MTCWTIGALKAHYRVERTTSGELLHRRLNSCLALMVAILLVMTTPWADLLKSLRAVRAPQVFVLILSMTYRYIFLFLHTTNGMFLARKSRVVGRTTGSEQRRWITGTMGNLRSRAFKMSNDVYAAMTARGFQGSIRSSDAYHVKPVDLVWLGLAVMVAVVALAAGNVLP